MEDFPDGGRADKGERCRLFRNGLLLSDRRRGELLVIGRLRHRLRSQRLGLVRFGLLSGGLGRCLDGLRLGLGDDIGLLLFLGVLHDLLDGRLLITRRLER